MDLSDNNLIYRYWGKTTADGNPGISVFEHMRHVGHVARILVGQWRFVFEVLGLSGKEAAALAALHDVGKITPGFQRKCRAWIERHNLIEKERAKMWEQYVSDHSLVSQFSVQNFLKTIGAKTSSAALWAATVGAHHGRLHWGGERGLRSNPAGMTKDEWEETRQTEIIRIVDEFGPPLTINIKQNSPALWLVAGLISVADWIGSDERFFPPDMESAIPDVAAAARNALGEIGFLPLKIRKGLTFKALFPPPLEQPNVLQQAAVDMVKSPGLYVIEAPMGMGKTEAALLCAYNLLCADKAKGIYFALPTQATSNRIHLRVSDFVDRILDEDTKTRLIHGNSWLMEEMYYPKSTLLTEDPNENGGAVLRDWFASRKRALLAPFGVGTVDQALLAVVAARHFFVRRFALAGKVVIIDEVHSYDVYTGTLVRLLCLELVKLGCTVLLLSATLTGARRDALLQGSPDEAQAASYPLLSGRKRGEDIISALPVQEPPSKDVAIKFGSRPEAMKMALEVADQDGCVLWICNTVAAAQMDYTSLRDQSGNFSFKIGMLHSRFPFFQREALENHWMEILGKDNTQRKGCILVATQVVEQSVDLDADLMISELAPTDMLLQRLGRLWRHPRTHRPLEIPILHIIEESVSLESLKMASAADIKLSLGPKAFVYAPYVLLRTWELWSGRNSISLPDDIRGMVEATYEEREDEADGWRELQDDILGMEYAERWQSEREANIWQKLLDDLEGIQTRLNNVPTVSLVLARQVSKSEALLLDESLAAWGSSQFNLELARTLNRNLVRVLRPSVATESVRLQCDPVLENYIQGECLWGIVGNDGIINVPNIHTQKILRYTREKGVAQIKRRRTE